ncbi:MAG: hypothetical protein Q4E51_08660 [Lachnospiraceae bacterium]|nr:hypothetical protein [Lachnospiraceae bacterium]
MMTVIKCGDCAFRSQDGARCGITGISIDPEVDGCSKGQKSPYVCDICGRFIVESSIIDMDGETPHIICEKCHSKFGTCSLCDSAGYCDFAQNPIQIPPTVQKRIQQGPMIAMTEVMNPERIKETCMKNCGCFDPEIGCLRQSAGTCGKNKYTYK